MQSVGYALSTQLFIISNNLYDYSVVERSFHMILPKSSI